MTTSIARRRWSDNDKHIGSFITYAWREAKREVWWGAVLDSGDEESPGCHARLYLGRLTVLLDLPKIVQPWRHWVDCSKYEWAKSPTEGYWEIHEREFGFQIVEGHLSVMYGPQTNDSITTKRWGYFLPWTQWRHVRSSLYDAAGKHFWTEGKRERYEVRSAVEEACPKAVFEVEDYDGARIQAMTRIEEREYRFGDKWCKWLSLFRRPRIYRSLDIRFAAEVGPDKGSWKGGMTGHGIEMLPGELHDAAFRRYCEQEQRAKNGRFSLKFIGAAA